MDRNFLQIGLDEISSNSHKMGSGSSPVHYELKNIQFAVQISLQKFKAKNKTLHLLKKKSKWKHPVNFPFAKLPLSSIPTSADKPPLFCWPTQNSPSANQGPWVLWFWGLLRRRTVGVPYMAGSDGLGFRGPGSILPESIFLWFRGRSCQPTWELESYVVVEEDGAVGFRMAAY
jgi:hypothetical protein